MVASAAPSWRLLAVGHHLHRPILQDLTGRLTEEEDPIASARLYRTTLEGPKEVRSRRERYHVGGQVDATPKIIFNRMITDRERRRQTVSEKYVRSRSTKGIAGNI
jgi:hypothetical protein